MIVLKMYWLGSPLLELDDQPLRLEMRIRSLSWATSAYLLNHPPGKPWQRCSGRNSTSSRLSPTCGVTYLRSPGVCRPNF